MDILSAIIIGLVEGVTEFLPISSTAHILIASQLLGVRLGQVFEIAIQLGAMLAVLGLYINKSAFVFRLIPKLLCAFIPTALAGYFIYPYLAGLHSNFTLIGIVLISGGVIMILLPQQNIDREDVSDIELNWRQVITVGIAQAFAVIPGVSRSGGIFIVGEVANIPRRSLVAFSFLLGAGTILAASVYSFVREGIPVQELTDPLFLVVLSVAAISAWVSCRWLLEYMSYAPLRLFGWYRVVLGLILILFLV